MLVPLNKVTPDKNQPRKIIDQKSVENLAKSLKVEGLIHEIEVDENFVIIVGEMRYRAAKFLGWNDIEVSVYKGRIGPDERLRRQIAENLQQSGSKNGGQPMNVIDTARAWARLYKLRSGKDYPVGEFARKDFIREFGEIAEETGISVRNIRRSLEFLEYPQYILEDIIKGRASTLYEKANSLPEEVNSIKVRDKVNKAISEKKIISPDVLSKIKSIIKKKPEMLAIELERFTQQNKASKDANQLLDRILELRIALKKSNPEMWTDMDKQAVRSQLGPASSAIRTFYKNFKSLPEPK